MDYSSDLQGSGLERSDGMETYVGKVAWVVKLSFGRETDFKYVRAQTEGGAIRVAKHHSRLPSRADAYARVATWKDLGCVPVGLDQ